MNISKLVNLIWLKLMDLIEGSIFFTFINNAMELIGRMCKSSIFYTLLTNTTKDNFIKNNIIYKIFYMFFTFLNHLKIKVNPAFKDVKIGIYLEESVFLKFVGNIFDFNFKDIGFIELYMLFVLFVSPFFPTMLLGGMLGLGLISYFLKIIFTEEKSQLNFDITWLWIVIFVLITIFCGITSFTPKTSIKIAMLTSLLMISYFLVISIFNTKNKLKLMVFVFSLSAFLVGLIGFYQKLSGQIDRTWTDTELFEGLSLRVVSTFGNPNVYGEYLLLVIPIAAIMIYISKNILAKSYYGLLTLLLLLNLGLTYSRGCYLALLGGLFVFILFKEKRLIVLFSFSIFFLPFILPESMINRFLSIGDLSDSSTSYRIMIWQGTIRILKDYWLSGLGQGQEAFNFVYPLYSFSGVSAPHSHNVFFQVFVETGIAGFLTFLALLLSFFKNTISFIVQSNKKSVNTFLLALICGFTSFFIQGVFDYVFYNYSVFLIFFIYMGIVGASVNVHRKENA
ncbi:MAG: O-antigen ligase family protein [Lachnospirales bacterium]